MLKWNFLVPPHQRFTGIDKMPNIEELLGGAAFVRKFLLLILSFSIFNRYLSLVSSARWAKTPRMKGAYSKVGDTPVSLVRVLTSQLANTTWTPSVEDMSAASWVIGRLVWPRIVRPPFFLFC